MTDKLEKVITVVLADDHTIVRDGLKALLEAETDIRVVGEASTGRDAVEMVQAFSPAVAVLDISMPNLNGLQAAQQILTSPSQTKVLILSMYTDEEFVRQVMSIGASGYLVKQTAASDLLKAIREVNKGNAFFSPAIARVLLEQHRKSPAENSRTLTPREIEVLRLIARGLTNKEIGKELFISSKTVEKHRYRVMDKLDIHDVAGLTRYAVTKKLL